MIINKILGKVILSMMLREAFISIQVLRMKQYLKCKKKLNNLEKSNINKILT